MYSYSERDIIKKHKSQGQKLLEKLRRRSKLYEDQIFCDEYYELVLNEIDKSYNPKTKYSIIKFDSMLPEIVRKRIVDDGFKIVDVCNVDGSMVYTIKAGD